MALGFKTLRNVFGGLKNVVKPTDFDATPAEKIELNNFKFNPNATHGEIATSTFIGSLTIKEPEGIELLDLAGTGVDVAEEDRYLVKIPLRDDIYDPSLYEPFKHLHGLTMWGNSIYFAAPSRDGQVLSIEDFQALLDADEEFTLNVRNVFDDHMYVGYTAELNAFLNDPNANVYEPGAPV